MEIVETGQIWMTRLDAIRIINGDVFGCKVQISVVDNQMVSPKHCPFIVKSRTDDVVAGIVYIGNEEKSLVLTLVVSLPSTVFDYRISEIEYECDDRDLGKDW